ncbi:hypothetical protein F5883DRAFT_609990 [Diaporthe sp. PMI_573]|nr:hypothetical protein F5883DRAFT_609990 [Diaporthaceae sp. PMI_573]
MLTKSARPTSILRPSLKQQDAARPQSIASRIVTCFHKLPVRSSNETFSEHAAMHTAFGNAVRQAWPNNIFAAAAPDAIVNLNSKAKEGINWRVQYESTLYQQYLCALLLVNFLLINNATQQNYEYIDRQDLILFYYLSERGTLAVVRRVLTVESDLLYILKGIKFVDFLTSRDEFIYNRDVFYYTIQTLALMPPHPNILSPPRILVVASYLGNKGKAVCLQISSAVIHIHHIAHTYYMDIKLANFLVDDHGNTILINWEQSGAPLYTLAPEADGKWDVDEVDGLNAPPRLWSRRWPRACKAAEVFSLGRTMWMLLQEVPQEDVKDLDPKEIVVH